MATIAATVVTLIASTAIVQLGPSLHPEITGQFTEERNPYKCTIDYNVCDTESVNKCIDKYLKCVESMKHIDRIDRYINKRL